MYKQNQTHPFPHGNPKCNSILSLFVISATSELNLASELLFQSSKHLYRSKENCFCKDCENWARNRGSGIQGAGCRMHWEMTLFSSPSPLCSDPSWQRTRLQEHKTQLHPLHCWNAAPRVRAAEGRACVTHTQMKHCASHLGNAAKPKLQLVTVVGHLLLWTPFSQKCRCIAWSLLFAPSTTLTAHSLSWKNTHAGNWNYFRGRVYLPGSAGPFWNLWLLYQGYLCSFRQKRA